MLQHANQLAGSDDRQATVHTVTFYAVHADDLGLDGETPDRPL